jgi:hypothetical protein
MTKHPRSFIEILPRRIQLLPNKGLRGRLKHSRRPWGTLISNIRSALAMALPAFPAFPAFRRRNNRQCQTA